MADIGDPKTVAVIGLGNMGSALAESLLSAGFSVIVWNQTASKSEPLVERGAAAANSVVDAAQRTDLTIVCISDHASFASVIQRDEVATALDGKILAQLGVVTSNESRQTADWAEARNIGYLEGSILGIPHDVRKQVATLVCSGSKPVFDFSKNVLSAFGSPHHVSETTGAAYDFDKIMYSFGYASFLGFIQGAALAHACGFSITAYTDVVAERVPTFVDKFKVWGTQITDRNHETNEATIEVWADAFEKSLGLCRSLGVDDTLHAAILNNFKKATDAGYGGKEITGVFEVLLPKEV